MKDDYLNAYKAALESLPQRQRASLVALINVHGLRPDDPIIIGPVFMYMLLERTDTVLTRLESASDPKRLNLGISVLRVFSSIGDYLQPIAMVVSLACLLVCFCVAWGVHQIDSFGEHDRVCAVESLWLQHFEERYITGRLGHLANSLRGQAPYGCNE